MFFELLWTFLVFAPLLTLSFPLWCLFCVVFLFFAVVSHARNVSYLYFIDSSVRLLLSFLLVLWHKWHSSPCERSINSVLSYLQPSIQPPESRWKRSRRRFPKGGLRTPEHVGETHQAVWRRFSARDHQDTQVQEHGSRYNSQNLHVLSTMWDVHSVSGRWDMLDWGGMWNPPPAVSRWDDLKL